MMRDNALFFTCSLIEYIGRNQHLKRSDVVNKMGTKVTAGILKYSDVLHCEAIEKIADEYITLSKLPFGTYDNISACKYLVPDYWDIGDVYSRLITDTDSGDRVKTLFEVYNSKTASEIDDYNSALYFQSRDYIREYYIENH